jgi:hypothetical protein
MVGSGQAYAVADTTIATEEAAFLYSLTAMFGGGGRGFSELGMGANTEYDEVVKRPPARPSSGGRRTLRPSKEKIALGFEPRMGGAGGAVRTPRGFKGEMATAPISCTGEFAWDSKVPSVLSLEERFEKDLDLSRSPSIADATPPGPPSTADASPVSSFHRKGFAFGFERLTGDAAAGGGLRTPRSFKGNVAFGFERRMGGASDHRRATTLAVKLVLPRSSTSKGVEHHTAPRARWRPHRSPPRMVWRLRSPPRMPKLGDSCCCRCRTAT